MTQIDYDGPGELHVTNIQDARTIGKSQFDRVITVCQDEISDNVPDDIVYSHYCMSDGRPAVEEQYGGSCDYRLFAEAADELRGALLDDETVLIHCHAGRSRSVSVSSAALARIRDVYWRRALDSVLIQRSVYTVPDGLLVEHLQRYHFGGDDE